MQVERVEQGDPDPSVGRGGKERLAHCIGVRIGRSVRLMMHVMKLADRGDTGHRHLRKGGSGKAMVVLRGEAGGGAVHELSPCPERTGGRLGSTSQRPMKGVAVCVGEAGKRQTSEFSSINRGIHIWCDRSESSIGDIDSDTMGQVIIDER